MSYRRHKMMALQRMVEVEYVTFTSESPRINTGLYLSEVEGAVRCKYFAPSTVDAQYRLVQPRDGVAFQIYKNQIGSLSYSANGSWVDGGNFFCGTVPSGYTEFNVDWCNKTSSVYSTVNNKTATKTIANRSTQVVGPIMFAGGSPFANGKVYYVQFLKNGELVFDAIPVRIGKKGFFYDRVTDSLFGDGVGLIPGPKKIT